MSKPPFSRKIMIQMALTATTFAIITLAATAYWLNQNWGWFYDWFPQSQTSSPKPAALKPITLAQYNALSPGLNLDDVQTFLGSPGVELSRVEIPGTPASFSQQWQNPDGSNLIIIFQDNALTTKAQSGLK